MGAPVDYANYATVSTATRCFLELDPLAEALCEGVGPPAWLDSVDPMLDELATSYAVSRPAASIAPECLPAVAGVVASEEGAEVEMANNPPSDVQPTSDDGDGAARNTVPVASGRA